MNKQGLNLRRGVLSRVRIFVALVCLGLVPGASSLLSAAQDAQVTRIIKDVNVLGGNKASRPATLNDRIGPGTGVRTGAESRAELTFGDLSITRLGENTVFSFNEAGRTVQLGSGAVLVEAPPSSPGINVRTAAFTAAVSGGTGLIEFHLGGVSKIVILEGQGNITGKDGLVFILPAGKMVTMTPDGKFSEPVSVNVQKIMGSSKLITDFAELPNAALIYEVIQQQLGSANNPNGQPPHDSTIDSTIVRNDAAPVGGETPPPPPPSQYPVITSPNPYVINNTTTIVTDPTITTNGQSDPGGIYHGVAVDGPVSAALFGTTSGFDVVSGFDDQIHGDDEAAVFKFSNLQITGNPTVDTSNGPVAVGLLALGNITTGSPGGTITFSGLEGVLLAAQNGSITLGSEVSFNLAHDFTAYARGDNGDLTVQSNVTAGEHVNFFAQRDMVVSSTVSTGQVYFFSGGDSTIDGVNTIHASEMIISSLGNLSWEGETSDEIADHGTGEVTVQAVGNISVAGDFSFIRHSFANDALNFFFSSGGDFTVAGQLNLAIDNSNAGSTLNSSDLSVTSGGNLSANFATLLLTNRGGGQIGSAASIDLQVGGTLTTMVNGDDGFGASTSLAIYLSNRYDQTLSPNTSVIGSDATVNVSADAASIGGNLSALISNRGGEIDGNALLSFNVAHNLGVAGDVIWQILNDDGPPEGSANPVGGLIQGDATLQVSAGSLNVGNLTVQILNRNGGVVGPGGTIAGNANLTVDVGGDIAVGDAFFEIKNHSVSDGDSSGGTIGGNAAVDVTGRDLTSSGALMLDIDNHNGGQIGGNATVSGQFRNVSTDSDLTVRIRNAAGFIGGDASVGFTATGADGISLPNNATFEIVNSEATAAAPVTDEAAPPPAATIGGDATVAVNVSSGGFSTGNALTARIANDFASIGGAANVNIAVAGALETNNAESLENFQISNDGGSIGAAAGVSVSAGSISTPSFLAQIDNTSGNITGPATIVVNVDGDANVTGPDGISLYLFNQAGAIGAGAAGNGVSYTAGGDTSTTSLNLYIDNTFASIANGGNVSLHTVGTLMLDGGLGLEIDNYNGGMITTGGNVNAHFGGDVTDTAGNFHSLNFYVINGAGFFTPDVTGGTIGTGGNVDVTFDGNASTTGSATQGSFSAQIFNGNGGSIINGGNITVTATAGTGNISSGPLFVITDNRGGSIDQGGNITFHIAGAVTTQAQAVFEILNNGGNITDGGNIDVHAGSFDVGGLLLAAVDNETGAINDGGAGSLTLKSDGAITVGTGMWVLGTVTAGGDIQVNSMRSTDVTSDTAIAIGSGGIGRFAFLDGNNTAPLITHVLSAPAVTSDGGINMNGITDSDGAGTDAASLTINAAQLSFDSEGDIRGSNLTLNGGDSTSDAAAGSGGTLTVNTSTGNITVNRAIEATSGRQATAAAPSGNGGEVDLNATSGAVEVNTRIEVSSNDTEADTATPPPIRRSNSGGNITLTSGKASGTAIQVTSSGQLLSLLNDAATGPGGVITVKATGANSTAQIEGRVQADYGTIDIEQTGTDGSVVLGPGPVVSSAPQPAEIFIPALTMSADVAKVGALGTNGTLLVGNATINASTLISLYGGSAGTVEFYDTCSLTGAALKVIAANTIKIDNDVTVSITGGAAYIYADHRLYTGLGGDGTGGSFAGPIALADDYSARPAFGELPPPPSGDAPQGSSAPRTTTTRPTASGRPGSTAPRAKLTSTSQPTRTTPNAQAAGPRVLR